MSWLSPFTASPLSGPPVVNTATITIDAGAGHKAFGGVALMADGRLITSYRKALTHAGPTGDILVRFSSDFGLTWTAPTTVRTHTTSPVLSYSDNMVSVLASGRVIISYFTSDGTDPSGAWTIYSDNNGTTWSTPAAATSPYTYTAQDGAALELANGTILLPIYGNNISGSGITTTTVVKSTDGGLTFGNAVTLASGKNYNECGLAQLAGGTVVALVRNDTDAVTAQFTSPDNGATWAGSTNVGAASGRPVAVALASGGLLAVYRDVATGLVARMSWNSGTTWSAPTTIMAGFSTYGATCQIAGGLVIVVYSMQNADTDADLFARYITDGVGEVPTDSSRRRRRR